MVRQLNKEIDNKVDEIINYIKNTDSYKNYLKAKEILDSKEDIKNKIKEIKLYQKQIVNGIGNKKELENKIKDNLDYLENDITYISYKNYLDEVNNMLNIFENKINNYFNEVFH